MLTSKQRAHLRKLAHGIEPVVRVGKGGVSPELLKSIDEALEARELIKIELLNNCAEDIWGVADTVSGRTRSDVAQVIGRRIVLYRKSGERSKIEIPK